MIDEGFKALLESDDTELKASVLRELREEQAFRQTGEKYRFYEPNGKCEEFINAVGSGDYFTILFSAANGVGKTACGANIVVNLMYENPDNKWFNAPLFKKWPYPKKGRIVSSPTNLDAGLVKDLESWLPANRYKAQKKNRPFNSYFTTDTGWEFDVMSYEQSVEEFESVTLGWAWFDEPPPYAIYKAMVSRMRKGGIIFIGETPLEGSAWIYDELIANPNNEFKKHGKTFYVEADVEAACKQHGVRGHLEHEHIEAMIENYSEEEKQARIYGKSSHLIGLVYKQFSNKIHVIKPFDVTMRDYTVYQALDTHPRYPDRVVWIAVDKKGTKFIIDELSIGKVPIEEEAAKIREKDSQYRVVRRFIEPGAYVKDQHETGLTTAEKLAKHGLAYEPATKLRNTANKRIGYALDYEMNDGGMIKPPEMYVFETCVLTIHEFTHWMWSEWHGKTGEEKGQKQMPVDKDDHSIECVGRILITEPKFYPYVVEVDAYSGDDDDNIDPFD